MTTRRVFLAAPILTVTRPLAAQSILDVPPAPRGERLAYGPDENQFGELRVPVGRGPHPVAIVIHGGYWRARYDLAHIGHLCEAITKQGLATWSLEYRRIGNPGGGFPGTLDDVRSGAAHLKRIAMERSLDLERVVATGHSAGGHLVLWLAKQKELALRGIVPLAPVADLRRAWELKLSNTVVADFLGGSPQQVSERYRAASPIELVPLGVAQRVLHGATDDVVPIEISRAYVAAAEKSGDDARLIEVAGAGHFELIDPRSDAWPVVKSTILDLVK
ncbi:MAG TPA: alpha/beta hydrolase [Bryobacteraceae bacterium]|nr:alpha/beta hydrolase [Bryobacteraceae bacterium]